MAVTVIGGGGGSGSGGGSNVRVVLSGLSASSICVGEKCGLYGYNAMKDTNQTIEKTIPASGVIEFYGVPLTGTIEFRIFHNGGFNYTYSFEIDAFYNYTITITDYPKSSWGLYSDAEIASLVAQSDAGTIDLYNDCGWRIGDERNVSISAIAASGTYGGTSWTVGEAQAAQKITLVLMDRNHYTLASATAGGRTKDAFVVGTKNALSTGGYMNSTATNTGSWNGSARRNWCNAGFRQALPSSLRGIFKQFKTITAQTYNGSTNQTSVDYFTLFAEKEIFGSATYSNTTEAGALTQIKYYETADNRKKMLGDTATSFGYWWERSPSASNADYFCFVGSGGYPATDAATDPYGLAPFGCL